MGHCDITPLKDAIFQLADFLCGAKRAISSMEWQSKFAQQGKFKRHHRPAVELLVVLVQSPRRPAVQPLQVAQGCIHQLRPVTAEQTDQRAYKV